MEDSTQSPPLSVSPGIKAIPSHDDDFDFDTHNEIIDTRMKKDVDSSTTSNDSISSGSSSITSSGGGGGVVDEVDEDGEGFLSGEEEFEVGSERGGVDGTLVGELEEPQLGFATTPRAAGVPIAKVSADDDYDDEEDEDEDDVRVDDDENENGGVGAPKIRVLGGGDDEVVGWSVEGIKSGGVEAEAEAVVEKAETVKSGFENGGVQEEKGGVSEGGDEVEIGAVDETKVGAEVEGASIGSGVVESNIVNFNDAGDAVVDSINVDEVEVVRSGVVVVGKVGEGEDLEMKEADFAVVEKPSPVSEGISENETDESKVASLTDASESGLSVNEPVEVVDENLAGEEHSIADDVFGAIRSGVQEVKDFFFHHSKAKEAPLSNNDELDNESETLVGPVEKVAVNNLEHAAEIDVGNEDSELLVAEDFAQNEAEGYVDEEKKLESGARGGVDELQKELLDRHDEVEELNGAAENVVAIGDSYVEVDSEKENLLSFQSESTISGPIGEEKKPEAVIAEALDENLDVIQAVSGVDGEEDEQEDVSAIPELGQQTAVGSRAISQDLQAENEEAMNEAEEEEEREAEGSGTDAEETEGLIFGGSAAARQFMEELVQGSGAGSRSGQPNSFDPPTEVDGQIVTDSDEEVDSDEEGGEEELFDSAALAALLKAAGSAGSNPGPVTITSEDGARLFTIDRPAGLGSSVRSLRTASRPSNSSSIFNPPSQIAAAEENLTEDEKKRIEKIQELRVKYLRLVHRLGQSAEDTIANSVLYRLGHFAGRSGSQNVNLDQAKQEALQLEAEGKDDLDFSLNILVLGKTGVGKSATINSILGEDKVDINAFEPATDSVQEINGVVDGVKIRFIDTPGLKSYGKEQHYNGKLLASVKKFTMKRSPDIVLYVDRLDSQTRDLNDLPLLKTISSSLGPSVWKNTIVTLTHAASAPPDGQNGTPLSYEVFVAQRSHLVQQYVGQAVGEMRLMSTATNPVSLVENHPACRKNREGHKVLPNGQTWRPQLLLLCYSLKILSEASAFSKPQEPFDPRKLFGIRSRLQLPHFVSSLLQHRTHPKLPADQGIDNGDSDVELDDFSDSDVEEEDDEYDQLPPFKPLKKSQFKLLSKEQQKEYFEEYDYRVKLLQKKQLKEELKRIREMKKTGKAAGPDEYGDLEDDGAPATVQFPMADMTLPPSFDADNPAYRYRFLEPTSQFLVRPVLDSHSWDHDCGYDGVNVETNMPIADRLPTAVVVQVKKDKKDFSVHLDSSIAAKHGENGSTLAGFDIQAVGRQLAYTVRGETRHKTLKKNKTGAGFSVTFVGENMATGFKVEDQLAVGKRLVLVGSAGTVRSQKEATYGANLEVRLKSADFPIGQDQSSFMMSLIKYRGDLAVGANLQSQFSIGRGSKLAVRLQLNNKKTGSITVRTTSSEHVQIALAGLIPIVAAIYRTLRPAPNESYSLY